MLVYRKKLSIKTRKKIIDDTKSIVYYSHRLGNAEHGNLWNLYHDETNKHPTNAVNGICSISNQHSSHLIPFYSCFSLHLV